MATRWWSSVPLSTKVALLSAGLGVGSFIANNSLFTVMGGERAVVYDKLLGVQDKVRKEGTHFKVPFMWEPSIYSVRITPKEIHSTTGSRDLQTVRVSLRVLYRPDERKLKKIYQEIGLKYDAKVLPSIGNEVLKAVVAQFDAGELITQRDAVSAKVREGLIARATDFGIILEDVSITHLAFSDDYTKAIEHKQVAQQIAERQKFLVEKARLEKEAEVILAAGETEAAKLIMDAMTSGNRFLELRKLEAARDIARSLARSKNVVYIPGSNNMLLNMPSP